MERKDNQEITNKIINLVGLKIIDLYIIKKFLSSYFLAIVLILSIAVIFDLSEKIDDFLENGAGFSEIVFKYYLNFIPYFAVLFSSMFAFIAVIYFTSRMASNTEIIAILSSGMSFRRLLLPYMISALIIAGLSFFLSDRVIPHANKIKLDFEDRYIHNRPPSFSQKNFHRQIEPGIYIYLQNYSNISQVGYSFAIEKFEHGELVSKMMADQIRWDTATNKWSARRYYIRTIDGLNETITEDRKSVV